MQAQHQQQSSECAAAISAAYPNTSARRVILTVRQFVERNPAFTELGLRNLIFKGSPRLAADGSTINGNGLVECGALIRLGRKVLIDEAKFFGWIEAQQRTGRQ